MTTALFMHPSSLQHNTSTGHPERIARIETINEALGGDSWANLVRKEAMRATNEQLNLIHERRYVDGVLDNIPEDGFV
ncbi:MAG: histone deacetylase family protein, partial [Pseudomonadota bacterium]|nr:histone deacetylase family protein [Pseudomonadota bacterium]